MATKRRTGRGLLLVLMALVGLQLAASRATAGKATIMVGVKQTMHATLLTPEGKGPYPGVLLLHTSSGLKPADLEYGRRLVQQGYVVLVPAFMEAYGITAATRQATFTTDAEPIYADFVAALDTLEHQPQVAGSKLGAIGFSNGGYFALWLAATGKVRAGVSYYGALSGAATDKELSKFRAVFNKSSAPVLVLHGSNDETVPVQVANHMSAVLAAAGGPHEVKIYDGAGHSFDRLPGSESAAADAWQRTLAFFAQYLK
jgi:carboxymethylenebutenolidase